MIVHMHNSALITFETHADGMSTLTRPPVGTAATVIGRIINIHAFTGIIARRRSYGLSAPLESEIGSPLKILHKFHE
jgi:hypothetical protein